jgi:hypothetical protein
MLPWRSSMPRAALTRFKSIDGRKASKLRQQEHIGMAYTTTQQLLPDTKVGSGKIYRKPQTHKVFDEMSEAFLNSENSHIFTIAWFRYMDGFCSV